MAMNVGTASGKGPAPVMNVTPLVDVVLVLLIIFMVMTPLLQQEVLGAHAEAGEAGGREAGPAADPQPPLVLRVAADNAISVNGAAVTVDELPERLRRMFAAREDHILFFDAADEASYGLAVEVMDKAREGGAVTIAALTAALAAPPVAAAPGPPN